jgi:23S rRNA (uracil1939-C5)-methyltransferase
MACLPVLQSLTKCAASRSATVRFAITKTDTGLDCNVTGAKPLDKVMRMTLADYRTHFARLSWDGETIFTDTPPRIIMGAVRTHIPPGAFLQATPQGEQALLDAVTETIDPAASIIDLFAGCGTFSLPLAQKAAIHAVEGQDDLCAALDHAARHTSGLRHVTIERRDLFRRPIDAETLAQFDAVVIDPPRAGAQAQTHELAKAQIPRIAMVSCNPITFARDAAILIQAGYHIDWIQPVDQFRWSSHVEIAAQLHLPHKT